MAHRKHIHNYQSAQRLATDCTTEGVGVRVPVGLSRPTMGSTKPPIQWVPGARSPGVKRQRREADHSPPASAKAKKMWIYTSTSAYAFMT
jgi:hypothetical protein